MKGRVYILFDWINDELIAASFDKNEVLARVGKDFLEDKDIDSYRLKSVDVEDLEDEPQSKLEKYAIAFLKGEIESIENVLKLGHGSEAERNILEGLLSEYKADYNELMENRY